MEWKKEDKPTPFLTYVPHSFDLDMAVMVIGSGLGEVKKNPFSCLRYKKGKS